MSLWGGFDEPECPLDAGIEKRLELDLIIRKDAVEVSGDCATKDAPARGLLRATKEQWNAVLSRVDEHIHSTTSQGLLSAFFAERCIVIITPMRIVVTASAEVMLHKITGPLLQLVTDCGCGVEWASFMRRNTSSPWEADDETNLVMASEYAELKQAFPTGKPFLLGQVDSDHYFYFLFDRVDRTSADTVEDEVQVNVVMYNVSEPMDKLSQTIDVTTAGKGQGEYHQLLRSFSIRSAGGDTVVPCVTFETNDPEMPHASRISELLERYKPARVTLITLFDPQSTAARRFAAGDRCGLDTFSHYNVENRATNEFAPGYVIRKTMFARKD
jgi:S-adenosylmethionine decarboxylase